MGDVVDKKEWKEQTKRKGLHVLPWDWEWLRCYKKHRSITECCRGIFCSVRLEIEITHESEPEGHLHKTWVWKLTPVRFKSKGRKWVI